MSIGINELGKTPDLTYPFLELSRNSMLSFTARLTPFSDYNQSPRNMYQCQMAKQSMATPVYNYLHRTDNKLYRLIYPATPIVETQEHADFKMKDFCGGFNAVVAVLAHTGYSMEDACIINEASYNRGLGHGCVYSLLEVDLSFLDQRPNELRHVFSNVPIEAAGASGVRSTTVNESGLFNDKLGPDGIVAPGTKLKKSSVVAISVDTLTGKPKFHTYTKSEECFVESVTLVGAVGMANSHTGGTFNSKKNAATTFNGPLRKVRLRLRFPRNPMVGDKFSSRHGQKGVLSILWPQVDMPFTNEGIAPDIIINPHAFPSRMTIGMLIESMAGKSGAFHGTFQDGTPFRFNDEQKAIDYFGEQLGSAGYEYYGTETMHCGISGNEFTVRIFMGIVHYQRLRHMVTDKFQVRATGPVNQITRQPLKGKKLGGGIRFGEMERDAFISHGTSFLLQDRLLNCSDRHSGFVCTECGSLISTISDAADFICCTCNKKSIRKLRIPFVFQYLVAELAAMNIRVDVSI
ncbi:hypothetical protein GEMRC1_007648 [Eukaryota sp. GEM-RC1]